MRISDWSSDVCSSDLAIDRRYESQRRSKVATTDYIGFIEKIIGEERRIDSEIADVEDTSADIDGRIVAHLHRRIRRRPFIEEEAHAMGEVGAQTKLTNTPELQRILGANAVSPAVNKGTFVVNTIRRDQPGYAQYWRN